MDSAYIDKERFDAFVAYHKQGDAGVEGRVLAAISARLGLRPHQRFELVWCYQATYHIPSALRLYHDRNIPISKLTFRTDRRYMRCNGAFAKNMAAMTVTAYEQLIQCRTTTEAFRLMCGFPSVGRYAASMFLECFWSTNRPEWDDDFTYEWEPDENYTKGALLLMKKPDRDKLDNLFNRLKAATSDTGFARETSLCALEKMRKGTRWNGFYTERCISDALGTEYQGLILGSL